MQSALWAGFIFCLIQGHDVVEAARLGTLVAARSIAAEAPQGWSINPEDLNETLRAAPALLIPVRAPCGIPHGRR